MRWGCCPPPPPPPPEWPLKTGYGRHPNTTLAPALLGDQKLQAAFPIRPLVASMQNRPRPATRARSTRQILPPRPPWEPPECHDPVPAPPPQDEAGGPGPSGVLRGGRCSIPGHAGPERDLLPIRAMVGAGAMRPSLPYSVGALSYKNDPLPGAPSEEWVRLWEVGGVGGGPPPQKWC